MQLCATLVTPSSNHLIETWRGSNEVSLTLVNGLNQSMRFASAAQKLAVNAPTAPHAVVWPYATFGDAGKVADTKDVTDLNTVFVRFDNGVRLTVKPTKFRDDEVLVRANVGHGMIDLPSDRQAATWAGVVRGSKKCHRYSISCRRTSWPP